MSARTPNKANVIILAMRLLELGEFGLISLIHSKVARYEDSRRTPWHDVLVGIGDDAAAWQGNGRIQLATTDTLVQNVHFNLDIITWEELGRKALAVNISDIAAMGGIPKYALLSLALPGELEVEDLSKFTDSMANMAREFEVALVGGNVTIAPNVVITVTIIGSSKDSDLLRRSTASPGQQVAVTGYLGSSAAGLEIVKGRPVSDAKAGRLLRQAHFNPIPRVKEGQILVEQGVRTAIDISDGLVADLGHICEASNVSARLSLQQVPVHPAVVANFPDYEDLALSGGEDYELLFTADQTTIGRARQALDCPVTVIGDITDAKGPTRVIVVDRNGNVVPYQTGGWEHFKSEISEIRLP
jgi:thiamine-monophosphate kinase